jgi:predicted NAD-dependent protein-ADP-ribosyltransferase YbiA (DUF1768 family)
MDISSGSGWPASSLSNFAPHPFIIDGVECASMEGFLQSLKFKNPDMQVEVCKLVGKAAKYKGKPKSWWRDQTLYWRGVSIDRHSQEYQDLLDRAYNALANNEGFKRALLATGKATLTHNIGKRDPKKTILTRSEFCGRLVKLRDKLVSE